MSVPCLQVGPSSRYFSQWGHLGSHVFGSRVDSDFSSCDIGPHDWLRVHATVASVCRIISVARLC
jgi:hypothetical protein